MEVLGAHLPDIVGVEVGQLLHVEDGGGLGDAADVEDLGQLSQGEELPLGVLAPGRPAQQGDIVYHRLGQVAHGDEILVGGVALALGHLVVLIPHDGGAVDIGGHLPAEGLIEQVVLGGGGQVLAAPHHVGDAHQVVVHHVGEVVGGQAVGLQQHLVVQGVVVHGDVAEHRVGEGGLAPVGDLLPDHIGLPGVHPGLGLLGGEGAAGIVGPVKLAAVLLTLALAAEAVVGVALLHQQPGEVGVQAPPLGLDIGAHRAADVGALVPGQAALAQGGIDHLGGALHQAALVGVLDAEDEGAAAVPGDEPGVQGGAQVAHVHVAGGGGGEAGAHAALGNTRLQLGKPVQIHGKISFIIICATILFFSVRIVKGV